MAAAYAALLSLMHTVEQIQHHPCPPISIGMEQYESLTENITFLLEFLEGYSFCDSKEAAVTLERRIADAANAAEDIIESEIVDQIRCRRSTIYEKTQIVDQNLGQQSTVYQKIIGYFQCFRTRCDSDENRAIKLSQGLGEEIQNMDLLKTETMKINCLALGEVIQNMEFLKTEMMKVKEEMGVQDQQQPASSSRSRPTTTAKKNIMVSFDDVLIEILDKLTGGRLDRQIIPIVGMAGVGKTTLTQNMYVNPLVKQYFDVRAWATISQEYSMREILNEIVGQVNKEDMKENHEMTDNGLGEKLYKHLWGRRYLIVMDDMWSFDTWDKIKFFFPDRNNGSRIVVTTRLSNLASQLTSRSNNLEMKLLDDVKSWNLFCQTVFEEEGGCPRELERIGKEIAKNCRGLPLSIVVIGGLLVKSNHTQEYWEYIAENLNSILNTEDDERCFKILYMSYNQLPVHMKPCFLYLGVYPEDHAIRVSELTKLWVVEGFVRPISGKCLEETAKECLKDLVDRNLVIVDELGSTGNIKRCKIHDLLRDLCLREAHKDRFYYVARQPTVDAPKGMRRHVCPETSSKEDVPDGALQSCTVDVRTLICRAKDSLPSLKLLRIIKADYRGAWKFRDFNELENVLQCVNLRYVKLDVWAYMDAIFPSSVSLLWNLHTLYIGGTSITAPVDIWKMPQLRHVMVERLFLPTDDEQEDVVVLCNLQTLGILKNFNSNELVKRIPNIKKLKTEYTSFQDENYASGIDRLHKLESLSFHVYVYDIFSRKSFDFPQSLKKLTLIGTSLRQGDIMDKIGLLPLLEKFKWSFQIRTWETIEGQFRSIKFLEISYDGLESWMTESTHFPRLEHLVLVGLRQLKEIPSDIGEIPTLKSIKLNICSYTAVISAKRILEQQEELGDVGLQVRVRLEEMNEAVENLASLNFHIEHD